MKSPQIDWPSIRNRAAEIPDDAFDFVRDGLNHTVLFLHGAAVKVAGRAQTALPALPASPQPERTHVTGRDLCLGLKDLALQRWGLLAQTVLKRWGIERTEDFGTIVYAMIDRQELKAGNRDTLEDFKGVFDFDEAFGAVALRA